MLNGKSAARYHYKHCDGCSEYNYHTVKVECSGNCGLLFHDDKNCALVGEPIIHQHGGADAHDCYDC